nr:ribonuclease H-like domain-containing protein [Tanacetum cinerariifolium]
MNYLSQDVYMSLVYCDNAFDVWKELASTYNKVDGSVIFNLLQKINNVKQGGTLVADYYHRLNSVWREFDALTKLPKCVCEVRCSCDASKGLSLHQQLMKLMQFLMGLNDCYQSVKSALLTRDPLPKVKDAYTTVSREESYRGITESSRATKLKMSVTYFVAKCANQHLTISTVGIFDVVDITSLKITVGHHNSTLASISHVRNLKLSSNVVLYDVLVFPGYCVSLLSVNKLNIDSKMYVGFDEDECYIQDMKKEKVLKSSSESGGLYLFDMDKVNNSDLNIAKNCSVPVCEVYHRAKQARDPFYLSDHKSKGLGLYGFT